MNGRIETMLKYNAESTLIEKWVWEPGDGTRYRFIRAGDLIGMATMTGDTFVMMTAPGKLSADYITEKLAVDNYTALVFKWFCENIMTVTDTDCPEFSPAAQSDFLRTMQENNYRYI